MWVVGAVCTAAIVAPVLELELGFRPALAREDVAAAQRSPERLVWMGRDSPSLRAQVAALRARRGDLDGAEREADRALALFPTAESWSARGWIAQLRDELAPAIGDYEQAVKLDPTATEASNNLAWLRATSSNPMLRDAAEAVALAEANARATGLQQAWALDTLAVAYASAYRFDAAVHFGERAAELARDAGDAASVEEIRGRVALYRAGRPYLESAEGAERAASSSRRLPMRIEYRLQ